MSSTARAGTQRSAVIIRDQPLNAYQLTSSGKCTSAPGGGPSGTGAAIKDGTCTWKYLSTVDYISITGWSLDSQHWKKGTTYHFADQVTSDSPLRAYELADDSCTSTASPAGNLTAPPALSLPKFVTSDGCHWSYLGDISYSSGKSYNPTVTLTNSKSPATIQMKANYEAMLWNDREYVAGENGENSLIDVANHLANGHVGGEGGQLIGCEAPSVGQIAGYRSGRCPRIIVAAAPGESFADSLTPSDPLPGFDPRKGVAIYNDQPYRWPFEPAGFAIFDPFVDIIGLQIKSINGAAVWGTNQIIIRRSILDGGRKISGGGGESHAPIWLDAGPCVVANSLIISHSREGIVFKYPGIVLHDTIINLERPADSVGIETSNKWVYDNTVVADTAIFGFTHAGAAGNAKTSFSSESSNNVTDAPVGNSGNTNFMGNPGPYPVATIPGTTYGTSMASAFVDPGSDWRPKNGGPLFGKGHAFGRFSTFCNFVQGAHCANATAYNFDSPNIIGMSRPQDGRYDIGAW